MYFLFFSRRTHTHPRFLFCRTKQDCSPCRRTHTELKLLAACQDNTRPSNSFARSAFSSFLLALARAFVCQFLPFFSSSRTHTVLRFGQRVLCCTTKEACFDFVSNFGGQGEEKQARRSTPTTMHTHTDAIRMLCVVLQTCIQQR